ncbi:tRNA (guanosine(37)-N1)-methyltransferase TrmD [Candidatus Dependentiae bacterium]|nr:tRNA (guanosine(37)-N1)-methyltransferase TrmD [Candidatus Dependentiae bacterium]
MILSVLTLFPNLYEPFVNTSIIARARESGKLDINIVNLFSFAEPKKRIDAPTFGPGQGMLIRPDIVQKGLEKIEAEKSKAFKIFFSPQGRKLDQNLLNEIYSKALETNHVMLVPARYEGMDARVEEHYADMVISVGDFVLMGGDLPALMLIEGLTRLIPGVVGKEESVAKDSFTGPFVDYPAYCEPVEWQGMKVPEVLRSGNHKEIENWRANMAAQKTVKNHFQWLRTHVERDEDIKLSKKFIPNHYVALMHSEVNLPKEGSIESKVGTSSVTSLDIHDIARSAATFGLKKYFIVTPLVDQQKIVNRLITFWMSDQGIDYNPHRHEAVSAVEVIDNLEKILEKIEKIEGKKPIIIGTSAKEHGKIERITYFDQEKVWAEDRPVLFLLGTARGLSDTVLDKCDYLLIPLKGFSEFNHLSVRSASAIIFDRWLGINSAHN